MPIRLHVDLDTCQGHGLCYFAETELFQLRDEDGKAVVLHDPVPERLADRARQSVAVCPERAITLAEA